MSKHTPGPWEMCGMSVCDKDGDPIAHMAMPASDAGMAAVMQDARLIAAAPEMAEVLEKCDQYMERMARFMTREMMAPEEYNALKWQLDSLLARIRGDAP